MTPSSSDGGSDDHAAAHIKRVLEAWAGDPDFRRGIFEYPSSRQKLLDGVRIELCASDLSAFWKVLDPKRKGCPDNDKVLRELTSDPMGNLWIAWNRKKYEEIDRAASGWFNTGNRRFDAWRNRRSSRAKSEAFIPGGRNFLPPLMGFELSKGCSIQCWFCAFAPPRLQGYFPHMPENQRLWRDILASSWELFGPAVRTAVCYHSTEPTDNPDYFKFLKDFHEICGTYPHTTTANPLKDLEWTKNLMRIRETDLSTQDRFSVLSLGSLRAIHQAFSAEEMKNVQLAMQHKGSLAHKNHCGRALKYEKRLQAEMQFAQEAGPNNAIVPQLTLECTIGYLVNMVDRSIRLISPCNATDQRPLGCMVHAEGTFGNAAEFRDFISRSIEENMGEHLEKGNRLAFREDLTYERLEDGFALTSRYIRHAVKGNGHFLLLGDLICQKSLTTGEVTEKLIQAGMPLFEVITSLDQLYQKGLLSDG